MLYVQPVMQFLSLLVIFARNAAKKMVNADPAGHYETGGLV